MPRTRYQHPKVFRAGKRPQVWRARWHIYDAEGKRHSRAGTFGPTATTSRGEAQATADKRVQEETSKSPPPKTGLTLAQLMSDVYLPVHTRWGIQTRKAYEGTIKNHILPGLGEMPIEVLNNVALQKHLIRLATGGAGLELLKRVRTILHAALKAAVKGDYIPRNPAEDLEIPACKPPAETRSLTEEEVARLFGITEGRDRLWWRILVLCGARPGEVMVLRREDATDGEIRLAGSALYGKRGPTKNRKVRTVPIPHSLQAEIEKWLASRGDDSPLVFPSQRGTILRREGYPLWALERARKAAGIPDLDYHMTRRTFATLYEGDVADVQGILGHAQPAVTMKHYKKAIPERQREAIEALDRRVSGRKAEVVSIRRAG